MKILLIAILIFVLVTVYALIKNSSRIIRIEERDRLRLDVKENENENQRRNQQCK